MDDRLKQRLVGAVVLVVAVVVFVPWLLERDEDAAHIVPAPQPRPQVPLEPPPQDTDTRVVPLDSNAPAVSAPAATPKPPAAVEIAPPTPAPKAPPKVPAKSKGQTTAPSGFAVQLGSFSKAANARGLRDKLVAKGYTAFVQTKGSVTRVYVGPQKNRAEAEKVLKKLLAETKLKGIVVNFSK